MHINTSNETELTHAMAEAIQRVGEGCTKADLREWSRLRKSIAAAMQLLRGSTTCAFKTHALQLETSAPVSASPEAVSRTDGDSLDPDFTHESGKTPTAANAALWSVLSGLCLRPPDPRHHRRRGALRHGPSNLHRSRA